MPSFASLVLASALAVAPLAVGASALPQHLNLAVRQQQDPSTPLYLNSPYCNFFQCAVIWGAGDEAVVNWLNAPAGDVQVDLMIDASSRLAYPIAKAPAVSSTCDAGQGYGVEVPGTTCGGFVFTVPSTWANGNYSMRATSVQNPSIDSYTDVILIMNNGTVKETPFAIVSGSIESGEASSTTAPSATSSAASSSATATNQSSSGTARPTSSASRSSTSAAPSAASTSAPNSGVRTSSPVVLGSAAALALGLAMLI